MPRVAQVQAETGGNYCGGLNLSGLKPVSDDQLLKFAQDGKFAALARAQFLTGESPPTEAMPLEDPAQFAPPAPTAEGDEAAKAAE